MVHQYQLLIFQQHMRTFYRDVNLENSYKYLTLLSFLRRAGRGPTQPTRPNPQPVHRVGTTSQKTEKRLAFRSDNKSGPLFSNLINKQANQLFKVPNSSCLYPLDIQARFLCLAVYTHCIHMRFFYIYICIIILATGHQTLSNMDDNDIIIGIVLACVVAVHQLITAYSILFGLPTFLVRQAIHISTFCCHLSGCPIPLLCILLSS